MSLEIPQREAEWAAIIRLHFAPPAEMLNLNDRMHWRPKAALVAAWRRAAMVHARNGGAAGLRLGRKSLITISLPVRSPGARRDPHNWVATCKPIVDGLVDAGTLVDDSSKYVELAEPRFHSATEDAHVVIVIAIKELVR